MGDRWNLKILLHEWFYYKEEDDKSRPCWILKHVGEKELGNCDLDTTYNLYKNGMWEVR